jgi:4-hydroxy-tetrahydrodipicolinate reductase
MLNFAAFLFKRKIGAGLSFEEFEKRKNEGSLRHVGLFGVDAFHRQSTRMASGKGQKIKLNRSSRIVTIQTESLMILSGQVSGVRQTGKAWVKGEEKIKIIFRLLW